jgi:putative SOS response-associated peptidase YedK
MCGRFTLTDEIIYLQEFFQFEYSGETTPRYNISPGQNILTVVSDGNNRMGKDMKWGLVPNWAKDMKIGYKMINARAETIDTKPSFRNAFRKRRCLILADGYYEWQKSEQGKKPFRFVMKNATPFAFAGLWETWTKKEQQLISCTIITTDSNEVAKDVHDRMPVILPPNSYDQWLDPAFENTEQLKMLLKPYPSDEMEKYAVSTLVNTARNEGPELIAPLNSF